MARKKNPTFTPADVAKMINFNAGDSEWDYMPGDTSMEAKQAEGVAGLWNLLARQRLALLADEVGMGKTYQAMGVMLRLWLEKPQARILVMAPNQTLCNNWKKEFSIFIEKHCRVPFPSENYVPHIHVRLKDLAAAVEATPHPFHLTTIHALSGLVPQEEKENRKNAAAYYGEQYRRLMMQALGGGFDLIIIDEAHYFRNRHGDSQRAAAAQAFFGDEQERLGKKVLLLTATPNHSSPRNIFDILSYFKTIDKKYTDDVRGLMQDFAIRRLRKIQGRSKYAYRKEQASAASFAGRMDAELFFALYQKQLVKEMNKQGEGRRMLYGYLEGFESTGGSTGNHDDDDEKIHNDFNQAFDSALLNRLTRQFHDIYHRLPDHPKYDQLVNACIRDDPFTQSTPLHSNKHLVFVRRIPSVREITQRINARYDEMMAQRLMNAWQLPDEALAEWRASGWKREKFMSLISANTGEQTAWEEPLVDDIAADDPDMENEAKLSSKIADLFVVKKTDMRSTDCSNVSLRFRRPESLFSLFLEPARDGMTGCYDNYYRHKQEGRDRDSYGDAARDARLQREPTANTVAYKQPLPTAWGLMYQALPDSAKALLKKWGDDPAILENFANYLRTGYLFASPVMIELYCWFTEFNREQQKTEVQLRYQHFIKWVTPRLSGSLMQRYFAAAIETFETLCVKIVGQPLNNSDYSWRELSSLNSPGWYASGQSGNRERLIRGFNSPFFPNVLVATSVLQEGVNLHLECHQVHHYGIAWTPGDNEQRNGRVDRLFGRIDTQLKVEGEAEMNIHYPYLEGTFDQDQLASFIRHKHSMEEKLDSCEPQAFNSEIDLYQESLDWKRWLRQPGDNPFIDDPYPAKFEE